MSLLLAPVHLAFSATYAFATYYCLMVMKVPRDIPMGPSFNDFGGQLKFLTNINVILQCAFFFLSFVSDLAGPKPPSDPNKRTKLQRINDNFFAVLAFPLAILVCLTFWGLYAIDRELILSKAMDPFFPSWLNHMMHTVILPFQLIELALVRHHYPKRFSAILGLGTFMLVYGIWILIVYFSSGIWTYPFLAKLDWPQRFGFLGGTIVVSTLFYFVGEIASKLYWGRAQQSKSSKQGRSKNRQKSN